MNTLFVADYPRGRDYSMKNTCREQGNSVFVVALKYAHITEILKYIN